MRFGYLIATQLLIASPAMAWDYRNPEFGFSVAVPDRLLRCDVGEHHPFYHEEGFVVFLDGKPGDCVEQKTRRVIGHFGVYNAMLDADLEAMRAVFCDVPYERGHWTIGNLPAQACRIDKADGWIELDVYAASTQMQEDPDDGPIPYMRYSAYLRSRQETLAEDIRLFRVQLGRVTFFPPE